MVLMGATTSFSPSANARGPVCRTTPATLRQTASMYRRNKSGLSNIGRPNSIQKWPTFPFSNFSNRKPVHIHPNQPPGSRPGLILQIGMDDSGQNESARTRIFINCSLDCAKKPWNLLPFVQKHGLSQSP